MQGARRSRSYGRAAFERAHLMHVGEDAMNETVPAAPPSANGHIICPICLSRLTSWDELPRFRWDSAATRYVELKDPVNAGPEQRAQARIGASVRCPDPISSAGEHYLPANYGRYGQPVVLGFIGATSSGKTHLVSAMVGAVERGDLAVFGASSRPVDQALHHSFLEEKVRPLLNEARVLAPTQEKVVSFADALLIGPDGGRERPVALFDVAGGELGRGQTSKHGAKNFLAVADGLIFVVDPTQFSSGRIGEETFNTVLDLLRESGRLPYVSAAIVLNKADLLRFEDPITQWLRTDMVEIDPELTLRESADVFAYLDDCDARAWTRPYHDCGKATLHVASATGEPSPEAGATGVYPRGVTPRRVLLPLVALLAMTGVLTGEQAQRVGI